MIVKRWACKECGPRKLIQAELRYGRSPGNDKQTECDFCHEFRFCKCYKIEIGGKSAE